MEATILQEEIFEKFQVKIRNALVEIGFTGVTAPQKMAIPKILTGKNVLLIAPTGMGKTEAALLPIFQQFLALPEKPAGISIVYITPLRALNRDLLDRLEWWSGKLGIKIAVRHGDTSTSERRRQAEHPPDMLITTPETLQAILPGSKMKQHLSDVRWVVVDEIHELAIDKRGAQLAIALERLYDLTNMDFQRVGLSATIGSSIKISKFLGGVGRAVEVVRVPIAKRVKFQVECPFPTKTDRELAENLHTSPSAAARIRRLRELIEDHESILTFVNTREAAEILGSRFRVWDKEFPLAIHHSSISRRARIAAEEGFKNQNVKCLVCTSSMELGIDVGSVDLAIQYMSPRQVTRLVQRVGRSGHRIGKLSKGVILATSADDIFESLAVVVDALNEKLETANIHEDALDVLAHQLAGLALDHRRVSFNYALKIVRRAYPFRNLKKDVLISVLRQLYDQIPSIIWFNEEEELFGRRNETWQYYYGNLSMIPDEKRYSLIDIVNKERVGVLDEVFVVNYADVGRTIICKGQPWRILEKDEDQVSAEPVEDPEGAVPSWVGEEIPVPFDIAQKVGRCREKIAAALKEGRKHSQVTKDLASQFPINPQAASKIVRFIKEQLTANHPIPNDNRILIEGYGRFAVVNCCFGTLTNETLGRVLSALLTSQLGSSVAIRTDPYRIMLEFPTETDPSRIETLLKEIDPKTLQYILKITLKRSSLFQWKLIHVARRFGALERDIDRDKISFRKLSDALIDTPIFDETMREITQENLDIPNAVRVLQKIQNNQIKIITLKHDKDGEFSPISKLGLESLVRHELISPKKAERAIIKALKERINNQRVKLVCLHCGGWTTSLQVKNIPNPPQCPKCESRLIAALHRLNRETVTAIRKYYTNKSITLEEREQIKKAMKNANLVLSYGKKAILPLAAYGVGPETATRILAKARNEEELYREILNAERKFIRTRRFWN